MSFIRTLGTLALGFAAAKGYDRYKAGGGMQGLQDGLKTNPLAAGFVRQAQDMFAGLGEKAADARGTGGIAGMLGSFGTQAGERLTGMFDQLTGTSAATDMAEDSARLMIRAMVMAAKADGVIDPDERRIIMEHLGDSTPEERAFVEAEMERPVDAMALARDTADAARNQVYSAALMVCQGDSAAEQQFLSTLARGMGLDAPTVAGIHLTMGRSAPKA